MLPLGLLRRRALGLENLSAQGEGNMRVIVILLAVIAVLAWLGFELKDRYRDLSYILFGLSGIFAVLLFGALFGLYGA